MQNTPTIKLDRTIQNAQVLTGYDTNGSAQGSVSAEHELKQLQQRKDQLDKLCSNLKEITETLGKMQSELLKKHKDEIAELSIEIARKVLAYKIDNGDYEILEIIRQALDNAPAAEDVVIRLNPDDYANIEQIMKTPEAQLPKGITFVADAKIAPANCSLETPKGIVESFIEEHLEKINEALKKSG